MTKREIIAMAALQALLSGPINSDAETHEELCRAVARASVGYADALLAELSKPPLTPAQMAEGDYTSQMGS